VLEAAAWGIDREALAVAQQAVAEEIDPEDLAEAQQAAAEIAREALAVAQQAAEEVDPEDLAEAQQAVEIGVPLGVGPEDSTDQAHAPTAAGVPPAWALEEAASVVAAAVAVEGGGRHGRRT
jgi:hypothetical protein